MTTRKDVILKLYNEIFSYADKHFQGLFPAPDQIDAFDIVFYLSTYFSPYYEMKDYRTPIKNGLVMMDVEIDSDEFEKHYLSIHDKIHDLIKFIKTI